MILMLAWAKIICIIVILLYKVFLIIYVIWSCPSWYILFLIFRTHLHMTDFSGQRNQETPKTYKFPFLWKRGTGGGITACLAFHVPSTDCGNENGKQVRMLNVSRYYNILCNGGWNKGIIFTERMGARKIPLLNFFLNEKAYLNL